MLDSQKSTSYEFNADTKAMCSELNEPETVQDERRFMNFDRNIRKQEKANLKRSLRRRVEKVRNHRSSDMESDTGSDGLAVNSEGSGRSGDWGPPRIRRKSRSYRKRQEVRPSLTDSGISLSKTDLDSLSGLSMNTHSTPEYRQLNSYQKILHNAYARQQLKTAQGNATPSTTEDSSLEQKPNKHALLLNNSKSDVTGLKDNENAINNDKERSSHIVATDNHVATDIEEKENAILEQCIKNEKLVSGDAFNYVVDCSDAISRRQSRFPLPDHLNYPICRYRIKTEPTNRIHPLQKLKNGWKKLRSKKLFNDKQDNSADTDCYPEFYPNFVTSDNEDDDNEAILSRLSRNPNQRKNFAQRVFGRFGSRSYSVHSEKVLHDHDPVPRIPRSGSTRSVPEALQDMWSKTHFTEDILPCEQSNRKGLHKVISMPSIHTHKESENYFKQISNHTGNQVKSNNVNEVVDRISALKVTDHDTNCVGKSDKKVCFKDTTSNHYDDFRHQPEENATNNLTSSSRKYSSCHELYQRPSLNQNTKYVVPQMYFPPTPPCACCMPGQQVQFVPVYPYPNYVYQVPPYGGYPPMEFVPNFYPMNAMPGYYPSKNEHTFPMMHGAHAQRTVDNVVPPLDVKVEHEKMAEKRKISEMVFDTFV